MEARENGGSVKEVFCAFLRLGLTSFGGPIAHLGFFQRDLVDKRKWVSDAVYADLVALCQFLPGPASSQVGFALGYLRAGWLGGVAACVAFTAPSALLMIAFALGLAHFGPGAGWVQGLKLAAVAVVAQAVAGMASKLCPDRSRATLALGAAALILLHGMVWTQVAVILFGLAVGGFGFPSWASAESGASGGMRSVGGRRLAYGCLAVFGLLLVGLPLAAAVWPDRWLATLDGFYRAGSLVFGGGHVVLPLLETETVGRGWLDRSEFLAGYGAAQAVPGPLFTMAAFVGTVIGRDGPGVWMGLWCLMAILLPGFLLVLGVLPFWARLRSMPGARAALAGANAAVVGILLAALYTPVFVTAVQDSMGMVVVLAAFGALHFWKVPPWGVVVGCAGFGAVLGS
ncbi:MAG: chromate efflux transporter [Verrucomicrobiia bacterium]